MNENIKFDYRKKRETFIGKRGKKEDYRKTNAWKDVPGLVQLKNLRKALSHWWFKKRSTWSTWGIRDCLTPLLICFLVCETLHINFFKLLKTVICQIVEILTLSLFPFERNPWVSLEWRHHETCPQSVLQQGHWLQMCDLIL